MKIRAICPRLRLGPSGTVFQTDNVGSASLCRTAPPLSFCESRSTRGLSPRVPACTLVSRRVMASSAAINLRRLSRRADSNSRTRFWRLNFTPRPGLLKHGQQRVVGNHILRLELRLLIEGRFAEVPNLTGAAIHQRDIRVISPSWTNSRSDPAVVGP